MVQKGSLTWHQSLERRADPSSDAELLDLLFHGQLFQCFRLTTSHTVQNFPETPGYDSPGAKRIKIPRFSSRGPDRKRVGGSSSGSLRKQCSDSQLLCVPCFSKVCSEVRGPRPQQVPRTPELPCLLQQPLLALELMQTAPLQQCRASSLGSSWCWVCSSRSRTSHA